MKYTVHLSTDRFHKFTEKESQIREVAGIIEASSLDDAYSKGQNTLNGLNYNWNSIEPRRSVSIGDLLVDENRNKFLVKSIGFKQL